jgi:tripartite-type tricarboxylate transporter receptor subunit TctC
MEIWMGPGIGVVRSPRHWSRHGIRPSGHPARSISSANSRSVLVCMTTRVALGRPSITAATSGKYTFGSAGVGTTQHLAGELFKSMAKLDIQHVPYRGAAGVITDLLGNRITMFFGNVAPLLPLIREGRLRGLAVTSPQRFAATPEFPTMTESGFPGFDVTASFGLLTAAGTPAGVIDKISRDTARVLAQDDLRAKLADIGVIVIGNSPAEFSAAIRTELVLWAKFIKEIGIKATE